MLPKKKKTIPYNVCESQMEDNKSVRFEINRTKKKLSVSGTRTHVHPHRDFLKSQTFYPLRYGDY